MPSIRLQAHEARSLANSSKTVFGGEEKSLTLLERVEVAFKECDAIGVKTCREMEGTYCDYVEKHLKKLVLLAGPVVPQLPDDQLDEYFKTWLQGFGKDTVLYCALGSESSLAIHQFQELVLGLELKGTCLFEMHCMLIYNTTIYRSHSPVTHRYALLGRSEAS